MIGWFIQTLTIRCSRNSWVKNGMHIKSDGIKNNTDSLHIVIYVQKYPRLCASKYVQMVSTWTELCIYLCIYVSMYLYLCMFVCICIYLYVSMSVLICRHGFMLLYVLSVYVYFPKWSIINHPWALPSLALKIITYVNKSGTPSLVSAHKSLLVKPITHGHPRANRWIICRKCCSWKPLIITDHG